MHLLLTGTRGSREMKMLSSSILNSLIFRLIFKSRRSSGCGLKLCHSSESSWTLSSRPGAVGDKHSRSYPPVVKWLRLPASITVGVGLIPGWGTKIPQSTQHGQNVKKKKKKKKKKKLWCWMDYQHYSEEDMVCHFSLHAALLVSDSIISNFPRRIWHISVSFSFGFII